MSLSLSSLSFFCANADSRERVEIHKILEANEIIINKYRNLLYPFLYILFLRTR